MCDSWYTCTKIVSAFRDKGFYTIGAIKTNRIVALEASKLQLGQLASALQLAGLNAGLVTVGKRQFFIYPCKVEINGIGKAIILLSYPREAFGEPSALRAFVCTDLSFTVMTILDHYVLRWNIEVFFRHAKQKLAFDNYQIRSSTGIKRFWLIMSLAISFAVWALTIYCLLKMEIAQRTNGIYLSLWLCVSSFGGCAGPCRLILCIFTNLLIYSFYLIIDRAGDGENTVHFLNQVDEADLLALMEDGTVTPAVCSCTDKCKPGAIDTSCQLCAVDMTECVGKEAPPEPDPEPIIDPEPEPEPEAKKDNKSGLLVGVLVVALAGGGAVYFLKFKKNKPDIKGSSDLDDYGDEDEPEDDVEDEDA